MNHWFDQLRTQADRQPWLAVGVGVVAAAVAGAVLWRLAGAVRRSVQGRVSSVLILIAALMATAVQSAGMWKFFAETMALPVGLRIFLFSFLEVALLACGTRAKENVRAGNDAGIDGVLVVVLALGSGVLSATDASTWQEVLVRLMVSVVAALLWERDLLATKYAARQDGKTHETVRWRFGWKTLAVRWGWADAGDASLADQGANRVFDQFVKATHAVNRSEPDSKQRRRAAGRQATAQARLMSYARLNTDLTQLMRTLGEVATAEGLTMLGVEAETGTAPRVDAYEPTEQEELTDQEELFDQEELEDAADTEHLNGAVIATPVLAVPAPRAAEPSLDEDLKSARLARRIVSQWPDDTKVPQKAFLAEFRKYRPISSRDGAALHRYAVGAADPGKNEGE